jgi:hypothetical protein
MANNFYLALLLQCISCLNLALAKLPSDVERYVERRDGCDHFRGEEPYDQERRIFLEKNMIELCAGTDKQLARLKKKYTKNREVMEKLNMFEKQIESAGQAAPLN